MKRYMLFSIKQYYAYGGMADFVGFFDDVNQAIDYFIKTEATDYTCQIYDTTNHTIVYNARREDDYDAEGLLPATIEESSMAPFHFLPHEDIKEGDKFK